MKKVFSVTMLIALFVLVGLTCMRATTGALVPATAEAAPANPPQMSCGGECAKCCGCICGDDANCMNVCRHDPGFSECHEVGHPPLCKSGTPNRKRMRKSSGHHAPRSNVTGSHFVAKLQR